MMHAHATNAYIRFIGWTLFLYGGSVLACHLIFRDPTLVELVAACKIASLFQLIIISEGITKSINEKSDGDVKLFSRLITFSAVILVVLLSIKLLKIDYSSTSLRPSFRQIIELIIDATSILSTTPIFSYAILNMWVGFFRKSTTNMHKWARCYFILADCTCTIPLIFVLLLLQFRGASTANDSDVFLSGAVTIIVLSSNIISKAIEEFFTEEIVSDISRIEECTINA